MNSTEQVKEQLKKFNLLDKYIEMQTSTATVSLAAAAIGCEEGQIGKTLSFKTKQGPILVLVMGTARVDNKKFKEAFKEKASFLKADEVLPMTGHPVGGVSPFAVKEGVKLFLDISLKKYPMTYPAAGSPNNAVKLTLEELQTVTGSPEWVDICQS